MCFAWSEHDRNGFPTVIELGAGGFGNGEHPATRLVVDVLVERIAGGERVLDVGCGSGVLGLCPRSRSERPAVVAVDIKPEAVDATRRNATLNGMQSQSSRRSQSARRNRRKVRRGRREHRSGGDRRPRSRALQARVPDTDGWRSAGSQPRNASKWSGSSDPLVELERRTSGEWSCVVLGHSDHSM